MLGAEKGKKPFSILIIGEVMGSYRHTVEERETGMFGENLEQPARDSGAHTVQGRIVEEEQMRNSLQDDRNNFLQVELRRWAEGWRQTLSGLGEGDPCKPEGNPEQMHSGLCKEA